MTDTIIDTKEPDSPLTPSEYKDLCDRVLRWAGSGGWGIDRRRAILEDLREYVGEYGKLSEMPREKIAHFLESRGVPK